MNRRFVYVEKQADPSFYVVDEDSYDLLSYNGVDDVWYGCILLINGNTRDVTFYFNTNVKVIAFSTVTGFGVASGSPSTTTTFGTTAVFTFPNYPVDPYDPYGYWIEFITQTGKSLYISIDQPSIYPAFWIYDNDGTSGSLVEDTGVWYGDAILVNGLSRDVTFYFNKPVIVTDFQSGEGLALHTDSPSNLSDYGTTAIFTFPDYPGSAPYDPFTYWITFETSDLYELYITVEQYQENINLPVVSTASISSIDKTTASSGGNVTYQGGSSVTARGVCWSQSYNPTITDSKTSNGTGTGFFTSSLTGLTNYTEYFVRAYATNSTGTSYGVNTSFTTLVDSTNTVTDIDGNVYPTVIIGTQTWMAENLKVKHFNDGTDLNTDVYYQYTEYFNSSNISFGLLYRSWVAMAVKNIAPTGWHVPTDAEWETLISYVGGASGAGGKLKETGVAPTGNWKNPNTAATDSYGFKALPAGYYSHGYIGIGRYAIWWSGDAYITRRATYNRYDIIRAFQSTFDYYSIRCVKD